MTMLCKNDDPFRPDRGRDNRNSRQFGLLARGIDLAVGDGDTAIDDLIAISTNPDLKQQAIR